MDIIRTPKSMGLSITGKCNLRCDYCLHFKSDSDVDNDLPKEEWIKFFEELKRCAVLHLSVEGGEPFLRNDLKDILVGIVQNNMRFSILTNGTLITDKISSFIASTSRCDFIQVSIDGSSHESHDIFRGKGSLKKAIDGIHLLMKYKIPVTVRVTIHKYNIDFLEQTVKLLLDELKIDDITTNSASYLGVCRENTNNIQLSVKDRSKAMKILFKLDKKYKDRINATSGPLSDAKIWLEMVKAKKAGKNYLPGRGYLKGCGGVFNKLDVRADGVIVPCILLSHIELGLINQVNLEEVWQNHYKLNRLRNRCDISLNEFEFCHSCEYIPYCTGNCPALAYTILGDDNHPSPDSCLKRFFDEGGQLPDDFY